MFTSSNGIRCFKKILSIITIFVFSFMVTSCNKTEPKDLNCTEIIQAYEDAGYTNVFHKHSDEENDNQECYIIIYETEESDSDLVEINIYSSIDAAKDAASKKKYNVVLWLLSSFMGETRWLESGYQGKVEYSSYNSKLLEPLKELFK